MGAKNALRVYDRYAGRINWKQLAILNYMALRSLDDDPEPYYSGGIERLAQALGDKPTEGQLVNLKKLIRQMVKDGLLTKDREASPLRKNPKDRTARYRLNLHEGVPSTPSMEECSVLPYEGVLSAGKVAHEGVLSTPHRSTYEEEEKEEYRWSGPPVRPRPTPVAVSPRCPQHQDTTEDKPCRACAQARERSVTALREATEAQTARDHDMALWRRWRGQQPDCDHGYPGGNIGEPHTGNLSCPFCRRTPQAREAS